MFMGSSSLGCPALDRLLGDPDLTLAAAITQADKPKGRALRVSPCPVKEYVSARGVPVLTPENVNDAGFLRTLRELRPDLVIVVAYGRILRPDVLATPRLGCVNLHASLLPKYRGAAPIQWAIARGERATGVTAMYMTERIDAGDIIFQQEVPIGEEDTAGVLHDRLAAAGAELVLRTARAILAGTAPRIPQNEDLATYAPKLRKEDGRIDWGMSSLEIGNRVRGFNPWPCCACEAPKGSGRLLRVLRARAEQWAGGAPGQVVDVEGGPLVRAGDTAVRLLEVQPEGRKPMSGEAFLRGHLLKPGDMLG